MMKILKLVSATCFWVGVGFLLFAVVQGFLLNYRVTTYLDTHSLVDKALALHTLGANERLGQILPFTSTLMIIGLFGILAFGGDKN